MKIPILTAEDRESWLALKDIDDDDIYAMIEARPTYYLPRITPERLLVGIAYSKAKDVIERSRKKVGQVRDVIIDKICTIWKSIKEEKDSLEEELVLGLILDVIRQVYPDPFFPAMPIAILICRTCSYSLDKLCEKYLN